MSGENQPGGPAVGDQRRILLCIGELSGGGAERVMTLLANHWAAVGRPVTLLTFADLNHPSAYPVDPRVVRIGAGIYSPDSKIKNVWAEIVRVSNLRRFATLRRLIIASGASGVISFLDRNNVATLVASTGLPIPVIVSERNHLTDLGSFWNAMRKITYRWARAVVAQTESNAAELRRLGLRRVEVIPNPVVMPKGNRRQSGGVREPVILAVGRLADQKDYPTLLRAFASVAGKHPGWTLRILGKGPRESAIRALADELGIAGRVHLEGWQSDVEEWYARASIFAMSSVREGFPNALCEAMAARLPVVCTDCPSGPSEIVRDGVDGRLVPVGDHESFASALDALMGDERLREAFGALAQEAMGRYAMPAIAARWERLLFPSSDEKGGAS